MNKTKDRMAICERFPDWVKNGGGCYCEGLKHKEAWNVDNLVKSPKGKKWWTNWLSKK